MHAAAADHVVRPDEHRVADPLRDRARLVGVLGRPPLRRELAGERREAAAVLGGVDRVERVAEQRHAGRGERRRQAQRRLARRRRRRRRPAARARTRRARCCGDERLEVEAVGGVVVGRHRLGVRVHQHRLVAELLQRLHGVDAAVVELDRLPDPVRPRADHDDRPARRLRALVVALVRDVVVRRPRLELAGARVDREPARRPPSETWSRPRPRAGGRRSTGGCPAARARAAPPRAAGPSARARGSRRARDAARRRRPGTRPAAASRPSIAFTNASANVRPSPSASPTARISAPRRRSASGNFSKSKRGALTAT